MNWEAISALADILGAIVVVVTLVYLARQIRQNTVATATATYDSIVSGFNEINSLLINNPDVASILLRGNEAPNKLTPTEAIQYAFLMRSYANLWLKLLRMREHGAYFEAEWQRFGLEAKQAFETAGGRIFREENQLFEDLYRALDQLDGDTISHVQLNTKRKDT